MPSAGPSPKRTAPTLILTLPDNGPRIGAAIAAETQTQTQTGTDVEIRHADDLDDAVAAAYEWARPPGGVVLLSPAAPSFGRFADYEDRARAFAAAAARCGTLS